MDHLSSGVCPCLCCPALTLEPLSFETLCFFQASRQQSTRTEGRLNPLSYPLPALPAITGSGHGGEGSRATLAGFSGSRVPAEVNGRLGTSDALIWGFIQGRMVSVKEGEELRGRGLCSGNGTRPWMVKLTPSCMVGAPTSRMWPFDRLRLYLASEVPLSSGTQTPAVP